MLTGKAKIAGVMGWPIGHSKSPALHNYWIADLKLDGAYVPLAVKPADLATALRALPALGFAGVNLTVPHKEEALRIVDEFDDIAQRIGAINTVIVTADGKLRGTNTDAYGFMANLKAGAPQFRADAEGPRRPVRPERKGGDGRLFVVHDAEEIAGAERDHPIQLVPLGRYSDRAGQGLFDRSGD